MKIILTESQLQELLSHTRNDKYFDELLDKISEEGFESLSDEEKTALNDLANFKDAGPKQSTNPVVDTPEPEFGREEMGDEDNDTLYHPHEPEAEAGYKENSPQQEFMSMAPKHHTIDAGGVTWSIENVDNFFKVSSRKIAFKLSLFDDGDPTKITLTFYGTPVDLFIDEVDDMRDFVIYFFHEMMPTILENIDEIKQHNQPD